jgi:hypothetical protein
MSAHNEHSHNQHGHGHDADHGQVESLVIQPKPVLLFLAILFVATSFVFVVVRGLDYGFRKLDVANGGPAETQVQSKERKLPPEPLLQGAPGKGSTATSDNPTQLPLDEMEKVRKDLIEKSENYSWVDKQAGIARMPIDEAKKLIIEKGLPSLPTASISAEVQQAETVRKQVLNAASSGGQKIGK